MCISYLKMFYIAVLVFGGVLSCFFPIRRDRLNKSTVNVQNLVHHGINYLSTGAACLTSTVPLMERLANFHLHFLISIGFSLAEALKSGIWKYIIQQSCWSPKGVVFPKDFCACNFTNRRYTSFEKLNINPWKIMVGRQSFPFLKWSLFKGHSFISGDVRFGKKGRINNRSDSIPIFLGMKNPGLSYGTHWYSIKHTLLRTNISHLRKRKHDFFRYLQRGHVSSLEGTISFSTSFFLGWC